MTDKNIECANCGATDTMPLLPGFGDTLGYDRWCIQCGSIRNHSNPEDWLKCNEFVGPEHRALDETHDPDAIEASGLPGQCGLCGGGWISIRDGNAWCHECGAFYYSDSQLGRKLDWYAHEATEKSSRSRPIVGPSECGKCGYRPLRSWGLQKIDGCILWCQQCGSVWTGDTGWFASNAVASLPAPASRDSVSQDPGVVLEWRRLYDAARKHIDQLARERNELSLQLMAIFKAREEGGGFD